MADKRLHNKTKPKQNTYAQHIISPIDSLSLLNAFYSFCAERQASYSEFGFSQNLSLIVEGFWVWDR